MSSSGVKRYRDTTPAPWRLSTTVFVSSENTFPAVSVPSRTMSSSLAMRPLRRFRCIGRWAHALPAGEFDHRYRQRSPKLPWPPDFYQALLFHGLLIPSISMREAANGRRRYVGTKLSPERVAGSTEGNEPVGLSTEQGPAGRMTTVIGSWLGLPE